MRRCPCAIVDTVAANPATTIATRTVSLVTGPPRLKVAH